MEKDNKWYLPIGDLAEAYSYKMELKEEYEYDFENGVNPNYIAQISIKFHDV